jgi:hypothetical protein
LGVAFSLRFNKFDLSAAASRAFRASAFALLTGWGFFGSLIAGDPTASILAAYLH